MKTEPGEYTAYFALWVTHHMGEKLTGFTYFFYWQGGIEHITLEV